jgi:hypothetical protein
MVDYRISFYFYQRAEGLGTIYNFQNKLPNLPGCKKEPKQQSLFLHAWHRV